MSAAELITVCAACESEHCWQGRLYCEDYRIAGTKQIPRRTIQELIERSSLGTPEAKAARESVSPILARAVVERSMRLAPGAANELVIVVHGLPASQGSKTRGANGSMREASKNLKPWREAVKYAALELGLGDSAYFATGPLAVRVVFTFPRPKNHYRTGKHARELRPDAAVYKSSAPDVEKCLRSTFDALTDAGVWKTDAQVAKCVGIKQYGTLAGAEITIRTLDGSA